MASRSRIAVLLPWLPPRLALASTRGLAFLCLLQRGELCILLLVLGLSPLLSCLVSPRLARLLLHVFPANDLHRSCHTLLLHLSLVLAVLVHSYRADRPCADGPVAGGPDSCWRGMCQINVSKCVTDARPQEYIPPKSARTPPIPKPDPIPVMNESLTQGFL